MVILFTLDLSWFVKVAYLEIMKISNQKSVTFAIEIILLLLYFVRAVTAFATNSRPHANELQPKSKYKSTLFCCSKWLQFKHFSC